jgi:lipopolysaccharide/colanic/teichoic acid biosynthesis glycosyltransferase
MDLLPYLFISVGCTFVVFLVCGLDRTPWRYSSVSDHLQIIVLTVLVVLLTLGLTFAANRLAGVARSLPVLQAGLIISILISARAVAQLWFKRQLNKNGNGHANGHSQETVLVVGVNTVTELFLLSVQELASQQIQVAGILAEESAMRGRAIRQKPILGTVDELQNILQSLEVHGVAVDRIVVATAADRLPPRALETLLEVEKTSNIVIHFLSERLGFKDSDSSATPSAISGREANIVSPVGDSDHANFVRSSFRLKRIVDVIGAAFLMLSLAPVTVVVAFIVALDLGFPLIFWQQRPGLYGRPFKMYKFRTLCAPHDEHWKRIPDDQRSSAVGQILRYTRLDELPQLYNVLVGDMSFVGPRPLLPCDQSPNYAVRLSVRPGITGWAQVNGGRIVSPSDKWILDIWYVNNASFVLDLKIVFRTVKTIFFGDRIDTQAIDQARRDLRRKTPLGTEEVAF